MGGKWKKLAFGLGALLCTGLLASLAWSFFGFNLNLKGDPSVKAPATQAIMSASLDANQLVQHGRDLLAAHDLVGAAQAFHDAVVADPSNQTANFFNAG